MYIHKILLNPISQMNKLRAWSKRVLPDKWLRILYGAVMHPYLLRKSASYDRKRFQRFSDDFRMNREVYLIGNIIKHYHVIEKGLAMPETRLGFGMEKLGALIKECECYITLFGATNPQLQHAIQVLEDYCELHRDRQWDLPPEVTTAIGELRKSGPRGTGAGGSLRHSTRDQYFKSTCAPFDLFSQSRASLRSFSDEDLPVERIFAALQLASNTPSACNRQSWRAHVFVERDRINEILRIQGGNRGFGHLASKLVVITGELGVYGHHFERNQVFIDGGMYAMNVLYALHFHKVGACVLNCSNSPAKDDILHRICRTSRSEVFIAMVACGNPADEFRLPASPRYPASMIVRLGDAHVGNHDEKLFNHESKQDAKELSDR